MRVSREPRATDAVISALGSLSVGERFLNVELTVVRLHPLARGLIGRASVQIGADEGRLIGVRAVASRSHLIKNIGCAGGTRHIRRESAEAFDGAHGRPHCTRYATFTKGMGQASLLK